MLGDTDWRSVGQHVADGQTKVADAKREFVRAGWGFAAPERDGGRSAVCIFDENAAGFGFDAANAPGGVTEEHDVTVVALDGEVFIESANIDAIGFGDNGVEGGVGDGSAAGNGCEASAPSGSQFFVDAIMMKVGAVAAALGGDAFGEHFEDALVGFAGEVLVGVSVAKQVEESVFVPLFRSTGGDNLLGQNVERGIGNDETVEVALADGADQSGAFDEIVAGGGKEAALGNGSAPMAGAAYALQGYGNG